MEFLRQLLELAPDQQGDTEEDQAVADINRKFGAGSDQAKQEIDKWKQQRLNQVSPRIKALLQQKERMIQQIDAQIARERQRSTN